MIVSAVWFKNFLVGPDIGLGLPPIVPALGVMSLGLLMVSPIPYHSFKDLRFGQSYSATVIPVIVSILLVLEPGLNFFLVGLAYVGSGPAGIVWRWRTGRALLPVVPTEKAGEEAAEPSSKQDQHAAHADPKVTSLTERKHGYLASEAREGAGRAREDER
jgi:hypothetical protein